MQQDFNLLLPAPESKDNLGLTPCCKSRRGQSQSRKKRKQDISHGGRWTHYGRVNAATHPQRGQQIPGERNLFGRKSSAARIVWTGKREHRFSWSSLPGAAAVLPLLCACPARGALLGMGLLGTKAGQEEGLLEGRMTPSKDKLAAGKSRARAAKEESFGSREEFQSCWSHRVGTGLSALSSSG